MSTKEHKTSPAHHYSGANPIPNIKQFVENLDKDKRERDKRIDEEAQARGATGDNSEARDHKQGQSVGVAGSRKKVTDPVTGREVEIENVNADFMKAVDDPQVGIYSAFDISLTKSSSFLYRMQM